MTGAALAVVIASVLPLVAAVSSALAVLTGGFTVYVLVSKRQSTLERRLAGYSPGAQRASGPRDGSESLTDTKMMQQAAGMAERLAERAGMLDRVRTMFEQAEVPIRPAEALLLWPIVAVLASAFGFLLFGGLLFGVVFFVLGLGVPVFLLRRKIKKRFRTFEEQLPDTLGLLAGSLRAGFSFMQGMEAVAEETVDPMRKELQRVFTEARLGRPIEEALEEVADRMKSDDLRWAVMAIRIQREVGGNLSELLDTVAETMVQRDRLRREIRSLTAEGRMSAYVLSIFPPAFALMLFMFQRDYIGLLLKEPMGIAALVVASLMGVAGWFWLKKIVNIEV
jgi:tight adherence protein B